MHSRAPILAVLLGALLTLPVSAPRAADGSWLYPDFAPDMQLVLGVTQMVQHHPDALVDLLRTLDGDVPVLGVIGLDSEREAVRQLLEAHDLSASSIELVKLPMQTMWMRDFGPIVGESGDGRLFFLDPYYEGTERNPDDDLVPRQLARILDVAVRPTPLQMEGGMLLSNGSGLVMLSTRALARHVRRGEDLEQVQAMVSASIPSQSIYLVRPLPGEPTGHLDVFLSLVEPTLCVMAGFDPEVNPKAAERVGEIAAQIQDAPTEAGPLRLAYVPTPPPTKSAWFSYTNIIQLGDIILVPTYSQIDDEWNQRALAFYRELLPERDVRGVDATSIIERHGALRCVSVNIPRRLRP